jgi:CRP/FNR family transcriptional regulator
MVSSSLSRVGTPPETPEQILIRFRRIALFNALSDEEILALTKQFALQRFDRDAFVFYENDLPSDTGSRVYFVTEGCVKLVKIATDGEMAILRLATVGEFFGVAGALTNRPLPFSAEALTQTTLLSLPRDAFVALVNQHPKSALDMLVALGDVLWFHYETHNQVIKKADARVGKILLYHLTRDGSIETPEGLQLKLPMPHDYIASMTGIAYEESVRIISRLKKQHACIHYSRGGKIVITNLKVLRRLADEGDSFGA